MLRIRELTLAGFGVYERPTRFLLPDGPAVFWGANETGKSTFLWGVVSVWFGLPQNSDPSKIGTSRFRSFSRPEEFWGELVWENDGRVYRLRRDFDRHKVCLTEESDGAVRELYHGDHNPSGRSSAGSAFPKRLSLALGLGSMEMFLETFCLTQPFVGDAEIESELQHLISGSRSVKADDVLAHLFSEIKTLTKSTGDLGLVRPGTSRPTNQREDGRLEEIQAELARARLDLELGRKHLEQIHAEGQDVRETEDEARALRTQIEERERRLKALTRWTELQDERSRRTETVRRLEGSAGELQALASDRERIEHETGHNPIYETAPDDAFDRLEALERADREQEAAKEREEAHQAKRAKLESKVTELEAKLTEEYADVRGRRDWIDVRNRLREAVARADRVEGGILKLKEEAERRERDLEETAALDGTVVASAKAHASVVLESHDRITKIETKLASHRKKMEERGYLEDQGRMALLQENHELETSLKECGTEVREKRAAVVLAKDLLDQAEEVSGESEAPEADRGGDDLDALEPVGTAEPETQATEPETQATEPETSAEIAEPGTKKSSGPPPGAIPVLSLALGAAVTLVTLFGLFWTLPSAVGLGLAVAALCFLLLGRLGNQPKPSAASTEEEDLSPGERLRRHLEETRTETSAESEGEGRSDELQRMRVALEEAETQLALALAREGEVEKRLAEIREELGDFASTTANELARMDERWKLLEEQIEALETERAEILEERFGTSDEDDWPSTPVSETNEGLESLLLLPGGPSPEDNPTLDDLLAWLSRLDAADWSAFQDAETARADARRELHDVQVRLEQAGEQTTDRKEIEELEERFRPFTLETDPKWLLEHQEECEEFERQLSRAQSQLEAMGPKERATTDRDVASELWNALTIDWPALGGPDLDRELDEPLHAWASRARKELRAWRDRSRRTTSLDESTPRILRSAGVESRDQLEARLAEERSALGLVVRELETLERSEIALVDTTTESPTDRAETLSRRRTNEVTAQERDLETLERLETALREKLRERATLEGKELPNLAALELRIGNLQAELEETKLRCEALTQAFRWADEATGTFRATYRESLGERIDHHFSRLTQVEGRRIELGDTFAIRVRDPKGRILEPEQLSQGARDQLLLAIRLGVADLLNESVPLPFLFDDPFVHFDEARLAQLKSGLDVLGRDRQWILLTHRKEMNSWADPVFTDTDVDAIGSGELAVGATNDSPRPKAAVAPATIRLVEVASGDDGKPEPTQREDKPRSKRGRRKKTRTPELKPKNGGQGKLFDLWGRSQ